MNPSAQVGGALLEVLYELNCPRCHNNAWPRGTKRYGQVACTACQHEIELLPGLIRLGTSRASGDGIAQRLMHAKPVVAVYERAWRPAITWALSGLSYRDEFAFLEKHLPSDPSARIVDWCCGTGLHARTLAARLTQPGLVVGIDTSAPMASAAASCAADAGAIRQVTIEGDVCEVRSRSTFDAGYCFAAFHLLEHQTKVLSHMATSLRGGAPFLCFTIYDGRTNAGGEPSARSLLGFRLRTRDCLEAMFTAAGFMVHELREEGKAIVILSSRREGRVSEGR